MRALLLSTLFLLVALPAAAQSAADRAAVDAVLDGFHQAAARGDRDRYLGYFTDEGVFFGTDPAERWSLDEFRPYVESRFQNGRGWTYIPRDRTVFFSPDGDTAWFDEAMDSPSGIEARGTGVLVKLNDEWKVAQYNFSVPFPNALWDDILAAIREHRAQ